LLGFNQTGELRLDVDYVAAPIAEMRTRSESRKNDMFSITNKPLMEEMFVGPDAYELHRLIKESQQELKDLLERKQRSVKCGCDPKGDPKKKSSEQQKELGRKIATLQRQLLQYIQHLFLRYFYSRGQLFHTSFGGQTPNYKNTMGQSTHYVDMTIEKYTGEGSAPQRIRNKPNESSSTVYDKIGADFVSARKTPDNMDKIKVDYGLESVKDDEALLRFSLFNLQSALCFSNIVQSYTSAAPNDGKNTKFGHFTFFPLRALIAALYEFNKGFTNQGDGSNELQSLPNICLGNMIHDSHHKEYWFNIGDILIEVGVFQRWLYNEFIATNTPSPTFDQFLKAIFRELVPTVLNHRTGHYTGTHYGMPAQEQYGILPSFRKKYKQERFKTYKSQYSAGGKINRQKLGSLHPVTREKSKASLLLYETLLRSIRTNPSAKEVKEPLLYYFQESYPNNNLKQASSAFLRRFGDRDKYDPERDFKDGIYYVFLGQDAGIVKNVSFSYLNDQYLNTLLARRNRNDLEPYLRYTYKANVEFVGNNLYYGRSAFFAIPVNQFNIDTNMDPFGLTGYYRIESTSDRISRGKYSTTVVATNVYTPATQRATTCKDAVCAKETGSEKEVPIFIEHRLSKYMEDALKEVPDLANSFRIKKAKKQEQKLDAPATSPTPPPPPANENNSWTNNNKNSEKDKLKGGPT
jgi:hypothetical protein